MDCTQVIQCPLPLERNSSEKNEIVASLTMNGITHDIYNSENVIGRGIGCSIVVNNEVISVDQVISTHHAIIEANGPEEHIIYDLGSTNRTKIGKTYLKPHVRYFINDGASLSFADILATYRYVSSSKSPEQRNASFVVPETPEKIENSRVASPEVSEMKDNDIIDSSDIDMFDEPFEGESSKQSTSCERPLKSDAIYFAATQEIDIFSSECKLSNDTSNNKFSLSPEDTTILASNNDVHKTHMLNQLDANESRNSDHTCTSIYDLPTQTPCEEDDVDENFLKTEAVAMDASSQELLNFKKEKDIESVALDIREADTLDPTNYEDSAVCLQTNEMPSIKNPESTTKSDLLSKPLLPEEDCRFNGKKINEIHTQELLCQTRDSSSDDEFFKLNEISGKDELKKLTKTIEGSSFGINYAFDGEILLKNVTETTVRTSMHFGDGSLKKHELNKSINMFEPTNSCTNIGKLSDFKDYEKITVYKDKKMKLSQMMKLSVDRPCSPTTQNVAITKSGLNKSSSESLTETVSDRNLSSVHPDKSNTSSFNACHDKNSDISLEDQEKISVGALSSNLESNLVEPCREGKDKIKQVKSFEEELPNKNNAKSSIDIDETPFLGFDSPKTAPEIKKCEFNEENNTLLQNLSLSKMTSPKIISTGNNILKDESKNQENMVVKNVHNDTDISNVAAQQDDNNDKKDHIQTISCQRSLHILRKQKEVIDDVSDLLTQPLLGPIENNNSIQGPEVSLVESPEATSLDKKKQIKLNKQEETIDELGDMLTKPVSRPVQYNSSTTCLNVDAAGSPERSPHKIKPTKFKRQEETLDDLGDMLTQPVLLPNATSSCRDMEATESPEASPLKVEPTILNKPEKAIDDLGDMLTQPVLLPNAISSCRDMDATESPEASPLKVEPTILNKPEEAIDDLGDMLTQPVLLPNATSSCRDMDATESPEASPHKIIPTILNKPEEAMDDLGDMLTQPVLLPNATSSCRDMDATESPEASPLKVEPTILNKPEEAMDDLGDMLTQPVLLPNATSSCRDMDATESPEASPHKIIPTILNKPEEAFDDLGDMLTQPVLLPNATSSCRDMEATESPEASPLKVEPTILNKPEEAFDDLGDMLTQPVLLPNATSSCRDMEATESPEASPLKVEPTILNKPKEAFDDLGDMLTQPVLLPNATSSCRDMDATESPEASPHKIIPTILNKPEEPIDDLGDMLTQPVLLPNATSSCRDMDAEESPKASPHKIKPTILNKPEEAIDDLGDMLTQPILQPGINNATSIRYDVSSPEASPQKVNPTILHKPEEAIDDLSDLLTQPVLLPAGNNSTSTCLDEDGVELPEASPDKTLNKQGDAAEDLGDMLTQPIELSNENSTHEDLITNQYCKEKMKDGFDGLCTQPDTLRGENFLSLGNFSYQNKGNKRFGVVEPVKIKLINEQEPDSKEKECDVSLGCMLTQPFLSSEAGASKSNQNISSTNEKCVSGKIKCNDREFKENKVKDFGSSSLCPSSCRSDSITKLSNNLPQEQNSKCSVELLDTKSLYSSMSRRHNSSRESVSQKFKCADNSGDVCENDLSIGEMLTQPICKIQNKKNIEKFTSEVDDSTENSVCEMPEQLSNFNLDHSLFNTGHTKLNKIDTEVIDGKSTLSDYGVLTRTENFESNVIAVPVNLKSINNITLRLKRNKKAVEVPKVVEKSDAASDDTQLRSENLETCVPLSNFVLTKDAPQKFSKDLKLHDIKQDQLKSKPELEKKPLSWQEDKNTTNGVKVNLTNENQNEPAKKIEPCASHQVSPSKVDGKFTNKPSKVFVNVADKKEITEMGRGKRKRVKKVFEDFCTHENLKSECAPVSGSDLSENNHNISENYTVSPVLETLILTTNKKQKKISVKELEKVDQVLPSHNRKKKTKENSSEQCNSTSRESDIGLIQNTESLKTSNVSPSKCSSRNLSSTKPVKCHEECSNNDLFIKDSACLRSWNSPLNKSKKIKTYRNKKSSDGFESNCSSKREMNQTEVCGDLLPTISQDKPSNNTNNSPMEPPPPTRTFQKQHVTRMSIVEKVITLDEINEPSSSNLHLKRKVDEDVMVFKDKKFKSKNSGEIRVVTRKKKKESPRSLSELQDIANKEIKISNCELSPIVKLERCNQSFILNNLTKQISPITLKQRTRVSKKNKLVSAVCENTEKLNNQPLKSSTPVKHAELKDEHRTFEQKTGNKKRSVRNVSLNKSASTNDESLPSTSCEESSPSRRSGRKRKINSRLQACYGSSENILFTGYSDPKAVAIINKLGGTIVDCPKKCTVLVTDKVRRTVKFLCALALGRPIVSPQWLTCSNSFQSFLSHDNYLLKDKEAEKQHCFSLKESIATAKKSRLLEGKSIFVTSSVKPPPIEMKSIIECSGGTFLSKPPLPRTEHAVIVSCIEDKSKWSTLKKKCPNVPIVSSEFILTGILQQNVDPSKYSL